METPIYDRLVRERGIDPVTPHYRMRAVLGTRGYSDDAVARMIVNFHKAHLDWLSTDQERR